VPSEQQSSTSPPVKNDFLDNDRHSSHSSVAHRHLPSVPTLSLTGSKNENFNSVRQRACTGGISDFVTMSERYAFPREPVGSSRTEKHLFENRSHPRSPILGVDDDLEIAFDRLRQQRLAADSEEFRKTMPTSRLRAEMMLGSRGITDNNREKLTQTYNGSSMKSMLQTNGQSCSLSPRQKRALSVNENHRTNQLRQRAEKERVKAAVQLRRNSGRPIDNFRDDDDGGVRGAKPLQKFLPRK